MTNQEIAVILIIEDDEAIRDSYTLYLEDKNYQVLSAQNGQEGIAIFDENKVDLVLLDLRMPKMSGLEVLEILSRKAPEIPTIVASGTRDVEDAVEALNAGAWNYLLKPVTDLNLVGSTVENALTKARLILENRNYQTELESKVAERTRELERTYKELSGHKEQLEQILDNVQTGIVIIEKKNRTILYINPAAVLMIGTNPEHILGNKCYAFFCSAEADSCPILEMGETVNSSERILRRPDGEEFPILKTVSETLFNGKACLLESFIDLRDQKKSAAEKERLEIQLRQAQKLESIGTLAGGVAHDFNNLLAGIMGAAEILQENIAGQSDAEEYLDMIINTSEKAADLTSKLLDFSRRKDTMVIDTVDVHRVIEDSLTILNHTLDRRISISLDLAADNAAVIADPGTLQNIFINLGVNSGHAMPTGGRIFIASENITIRNGVKGNSVHQVPPGSYLKITFEDSGCGMDPEIKERVFEPFFTTKEPGHGTGLGLAAVYGIIREIHGSIYVYSEKDIGTVFHIYLPLSDETVKTSENSISEWEEGEKLTILIIEDDEIIRNMTDRMLRQAEHRVIVSRTADEGIELYKKKKDSIDVVLIDMIMPEKTGPECFRAIRTVNPEAKILLSSGFSHSVYSETPEKDSNCGFISKPYRLNSLQTSLYTLIRR